MNKPIYRKVINHEHTSTGFRSTITTVEVTQEYFDRLEKENESLKNEVFNSPIEEYEL